MTYTRILAPDQLTVDDRLRFVVRFAVMPLDALRQGDWLNLGEDVRDFLGEPLFAGGATKPPVGVFTVRPLFTTLSDFPETLDGFQGLMRGLQPDTRRILEALAVDVDAQGAIDYQASLARTGSDPFPRVEIRYSPFFASVRGPVKDVFHWHLHRLIVEAPVDKVVRCRECQTLFYRVKHQVHCSRACTNRVSQRRWRERHEAAAVS